MVERLGSESHVIFPVDAPRLAGAAAAAADEATEESEATLLAGGPARASPPGSRAGAGSRPARRSSSPCAPTPLHLFDPESGAALR